MEASWNLAEFSWVNVDELHGLTRSKKTKPILAKTMTAIIADQTMIPRFLLKTIEGNAECDATAMVCKGIGEDYWVQPKDKVVDRYDFADFADNGWVSMTPKPDKEVDAFQVTRAMCGSEGFAIRAGNWGEKATVDGEEVMVHFGRPGDYICIDPTDTSDRWIVLRTLFENSYESVEGASTGTAVEEEAEVSV